MFWLMLSAQQSIIIRFEDADPAGVVFYPRAIALAHAAVEDLLRRSALGWDAWFASPHYAAPLRRAAADFFLPMKLSHLLIILMDCSLASVLATASFFFERRLFSRGHNAHCAAGQDGRTQLSAQRSVCRRVIPKFQSRVRQ